jgi:hypothetical protein
MAKANDKSTTIDWIWLREALQEDAKAELGSKVLAETRLREWLAAVQLPWTYMSWQELDEAGIANLREDEPTLGRILSTLTWFWTAQSLWIDWDDSRAGDCRNCALGIKVSRRHLRALLRAGPEGEETRGSAAWITAEAERMKAESEITPNIKITDLARKLEQKMANAARCDPSLRPIKWESIRNKLREWGLWPITRIK